MVEVQVERSLPVAHGERLLPGVTLTHLVPGGAAGPDDVVRVSDVVGGRVWSDMWYLGSDADEFRMCIPEFRMPANHLVPAHWHDDWMFITILEGSVLIGDWLMEVGDVLVTTPKVEYGPLVVGPRGVQLLEVFAQNDKDGGYAEEYHDHPTLSNKNRYVIRPDIYTYGPQADFKFLPRPAGSESNAGSQVVKVEGTPGLLKGRLTDGESWNLGQDDDPLRGVALFSHFEENVKVLAHQVGDWRWTLVIKGSMTLGDCKLVEGDILIVEQDVSVPVLQVGSGGVDLLELCRTAKATDRRPL